MLEAATAIETIRVPLMCHRARGDLPLVARLAVMPTREGPEAGVAKNAVAIGAEAGIAARLIATEAGAVIAARTVLPAAGVEAVTGIQGAEIAAGVKKGQDHATKSRSAHNPSAETGHMSARMKNLVM